MLEEKKLKIINFLQDFGCATIEQLQTLFYEKDNNFKDILRSNVASKKGNIFIYNGKQIDMQTISALEILCKYRKRLKHYFKGFSPINIGFITNDNILYHIIVSDKNSELGIVKQLKQNPLPFPEADKYILLFEDEEMYEKIVFNKPYIYCIYPDIEIINNTK